MPLSDPRDRRRSERVMLQIPIKVLAETPDSVHVEESTHTLVVNAHGGLMKADRIGPIRRSRRKDTGQSPIRVRAWMYLQNLTVSTVQPSENDDLVAHCEPLQGLRGKG